MTPKTVQETTAALVRAASGDQRSQQEFFELLYGELRGLARGVLRGERAGHTLQPTALVHEAWVRLVDGSAIAAIAVEGDAGGDTESARGRFLGLAARAMRQVLIDHARRQNAGKRGSAWQRITLSSDLSAQPLELATLLDLDAALVEMERRQPRLAQVSELRLFAGLELAEVAATVGISLTTAKLDWNLARAMLTRRLAEG
ncbi:MAG: ECF-type sigma factor [Planctomycetota bacterium]